MTDTNDLKCQHEKRPLNIQLGHDVFMHKRLGALASTTKHRRRTL